MGTLQCSIKIIEAPYVFDWEYGIALHAVQGNRASSPCEGDVSWDFSSCGRNLGYTLDLEQRWAIEIPLCSPKSAQLPSYDGQLRNLNYSWQDNTDASGDEELDPASLSSFHRDTGIPIHFQEESGLVTF